MTDASFELLLKRAQRIDNDDLDRKLVLAENSSIPVGRASKTEQKQLVPAFDNAWIRNPVISRTHAEITMTESLGMSQIYIEDKKSSHGTFVNGKKIQEKLVLKSGDRLQFGSDVQRGDETFRPPVFDVEIVKMPPPTLHELQLDTRANVGRTMSCPEETEDSDSSSDLESEAESDKESTSSVQVVEDRFEPKTPGDNATVKPAVTGVPGSQTNPWTLDEVVPTTATIDLVGDEMEASNITPDESPIRQVISAAAFEACDSDAEAVASDEDLMEMYSDSSSESEVAEDEREDGEVDYPDEDEDEDEEEDEAENEYEPGYDPEINEPLDILPGYAPSSPRYTPTSPISPRFSCNLLPNDLPAVHVEESNSGRSNPPPVGEYSPIPAPYSAFFGYGDGPFAYGSNATSGKPLHTREPQHSYVRALHAHLEEDIANNEDFQAWYDFPPPAAAAATVSMPAYSFGPSQQQRASYLPAKLTPRAPSAVTTSTLDMIGSNSRASNKNDMSIDNLINPPVDKAPTSKKRKADELADEDENDSVLDPHSNLPDQTTAPAQNSIETGLQERVTMDSAAVSKAPRAIAQPSTKRRKLAYGLSCAAMGTVFGMVGTFAALMSIPDGQFK